MTLNTFLKDIQFWLNSGVNHFLQNDPQILYQNYSIQKKAQNNSFPKKVMDIETLNELELFLSLIHI